MDGADRLIGFQHADQPLDLTPAAKMDDVAEIAAAIGAHGGFQRRVQTVMREQIGRVGKHGAVGNIGRDHGAAVYRAILAAARKDKVNASLTMRRGYGHATAMTTRRNTRSAGIAFAILPIAGAFIGGYQGQPVIGLLAGFALAALIVTLFWAFDRRQ